MRGRVRNWARLVKGKPVFDKDAPSAVDFSSHDRMLVAQAAGRVVDLTETDSVRPENARTAPSRNSDGLETTPQGPMVLLRAFPPLARRKRRDLEALRLTIANPGGGA